MAFAPEKIKTLHQEVGGSFFAYDLDSMEAHLKSLATPGIRLWYACKANPLSAVLQTVQSAGLSFDVASVGELDQVLRQGISGDRILLTGPAKSAKFLSKAFAAGVNTFVAESHAQLDQLQELAQKNNRKVDVLLRLQLAWADSESSVLGGSKTTVFGLCPEEWGDLSAYKNLNFRGVHVFQWGNQLDLTKLAAIWQAIAKAARNFCADKKIPLDVLDLGGGLGISYQKSGQYLAWSEAKIILEKIKTGSGAKELWLELGRYAVGPFGSYVTEILERKTVRGENFLICAGGAQHLLRPALVGESFPAQALVAQNTTTAFHVHGPLCTALDRLGSYELPAATAKGDLLLFSQCGAYGFTESMPFFLCHELPAELVLHHGKWTVLRPVADASSWLR